MRLRRVVTNKFGAQPPKPTRRRAVPMLLMSAIPLVGAALWVRMSPWSREVSLRSKDLNGLELAVRNSPDDPLARYYLAKTYYIQNRFTDARDAYNVAIRLDASSARPHLGLALAAYKLGDIEQAKSEFEETLRLDNGSAWAEYMIGKIQWQRGDINS